MSQERIRIAFEAIDGTPELRGAIEGHIAELERRHGPICECRVVVKGPAAHGAASRYEVGVRLAPAAGIEVVVGPPPHDDERYADPTFAVDDTFRRARRRLQDQARRDRTKAQMKDAGPAKREPALRASRKDVAPTRAKAKPLPAEAARPAPKRAAPASGEAPSAEPSSIEPRPATTGNAEPAPSLDAQLEQAQAETANPPPPAPPAIRPRQSEPLFPAPQSAKAASLEPPAPAAPAHMRPPPNEASGTNPPPNVAEAATSADPVDLNAAATTGTVDSLAFAQAMGSLMRAAAMLNVASTQWMKSYLTCSAEILSSMMAPSQAASKDAGTSATDAQNAPSEAVAPSRRATGD